MSDDELCDLGLQFPDFLAQSDEIDRMIEERAGAFNLNGTNIRNILYHVVQLGVHQLTNPTDQIWDEDPILQLPEPKTRAAKQKHQRDSGQAGSSSSAPLLTLPEVRSPDHEDEEDDQDYNPHQDTEGSDESDEDHETDSIAPKTPKSVVETPTRVQKESESEHVSTPTLARRTRSLFNLKDKDLIELELDLPPEEEVESDGEQRKISEALEEGYEELENEPDEDTEEESSVEEEIQSQTESESEDAPNEHTFNQFLAGIANPKEEFPEENSRAKDTDYRYRMEYQLEEEEFRTDKEVTVTKREVSELLRELDKMDPSVKDDIAELKRSCKKPLPTVEEINVEEGPLFTDATLGVLKEQLQMHLQLLVQHSILASDIESLEETRGVACKRIEELEDLSSQCSTEGLLQAMEGLEHTETSVLRCLDIYPALRLVSCDKYCDNKDPAQSIPIKVSREVAGIKHIEPLPRKKYNLLNYQPFFQRFLHIRPTVNFICRTKIKPNANRYFTEIEDNLVAHGLDAFAHVNDQKQVHKLIQEYYLPTKTPKQICIRIKNKSSTTSYDNVIKHWKDTGTIRYNTYYMTNNLMKRLSVPVTNTDTVPIAPAISVANLDWLRALREHRRKLQRDYNKKKQQRVVCTKSSVIATAKLMSLDETHNFEIAFLLKAKEVLKNDPETYFKMFQSLAEYNQMCKFDCEEVIKRIMKILRNYPELGFEFMSIFSPLPEMPVDQLLETLSHIKTRLLFRNLERHFKSNPHQYKKVIRLILGANANNPTIARDTLLNMLRGKQELCDQVLDFFDKCSVKPEPHEFEYIDLTDKNAENWAERQDDFEEVYLLEKTSKTAKKNTELVQSINKFHDEKRQQEKEDIIAKKDREREEKRKRYLEKRKISAKNIVECGDIVVTWTRDQDREILKGCKTMGPMSKTFKMLAKTFPNKTDKQVKARYFTLMELMKKARKAAGRKALLRQKQLAAEASAAEASASDTNNNNAAAADGKGIKPKGSKKCPLTPVKNTTTLSAKRPKFINESKPGPSCES